LAEVVVADNASTDNSVAVMRESFPNVRLIENGSNGGFATGYNLALRQIEAQYYVLLNSDIEVPQGWIEPVIELMDAHPEIAACQPKILSYYHKEQFEYAGASGGFIDKYGYPFCRGRVFQNLEDDKGQYDDPREVFWATGACMFVRADLYHQVGGLDDSFFAHMEEIDLCWRMQLRGWTVNLVPASYVYHIGGGTLPNESPFKLRLNFRNNLLLLENNLPSTLQSRFRTRIRIFLRMCLDGLSALVYLFTGRWEFFRSVLQAHKEYRRLRRPGELLKDARHPDGLYNGWIVPIGLFGKK
jgi:hypothetical protein